MNAARPVIPFMLALTLLPAAAHADEKPNGRIAGVVVDGGARPIAGATVILATSGLSENVAAARSDGNGRFLFRALPAGSYSLLAVFGEAHALSKDLELGPGAKLEVAPVLALDPEVITIHEHEPAPTPPRPIASTVKRVLPWSDQAIDEDIWAVGWLLLDIDATGKVSGFRFLHHPGKGLDEIAREEVWRLRFEPARDAAGRGVPSQSLWRMEWPAYWSWYQRHVMTPTATYLPASILSAGRPMDFHAYGRLGGEVFMLPRTSRDVLPPCGGQAPMQLDRRDPTYRDCSAPDLEHAFSEPLIVRAAGLQ